MSGKQTVKIDRFSFDGFGSALCANYLLGTDTGGNFARRECLLVCVQALRQADQIKRLHANYASARAINVGYEKEGDRNSKRQDYEQEASSMCAISDQEVAAYADRCQQDPGFERNPVPP